MKRLTKKSVENKIKAEYGRTICIGSPSEWSSSSHLAGKYAYSECTDRGIYEPEIAFDTLRDLYDYVSTECDEIDLICSLA